MRLHFKSSRLWRYASLMLLAGLGFSLPARSQDVILQGFYWNTHPGDLTNTTIGGIWWDTLTLVAPQVSGAGFKTIWVPPPTKSFAGTLDMGYGPYDYFDLGEYNGKGTIRTRHGSRAELNAMIQAMHNNNISVMADLVINHRGGGDAQAPYQVGGNTGYLVFTPPSLRMNSGPQHFHPTFFHPDQNPDYHNPLFFEDICYFNEGDVLPPTTFDGAPGSWYHGLAANTPIGSMGDSLIMWGRWMRDQVGFDELRLDAVKHIDPEYLAKFIVEMSTGEQPFTLGEFFDYSTGALEYYHNAVENSGNAGSKQPDMSLFDFPLRGALQSVLNNGAGTADLYQTLGGKGLVWGSTIPADDVVTWLDSHDTDRTGYIPDNGNCAIPYGGGCLALHTENDHNPIFQDKEDMGYPLLMASEGRPMVFWKDWYWYGLSKDIKWLMALRKATAKGASNHIQQMSGVWSSSAPFDANNHGGNMFAMRRNGNTPGPGNTEGMVLGLNDHPTKTNGVEVNTPFTDKYLKDYSDGFLFQSSYANSSSRALIKAQARDYSWWAPTGLYPTPPDGGASHFEMDATPGGCPHFIAMRVDDAANFIVDGAPISNGDQVAVKNAAGDVVGIGRIGQGFGWDGEHDMIIEVLGSPSTAGMANGELFRIFVYDASANEEVEVGGLTFAPQGLSFVFSPQRPNSPNRNGNVPMFSIATTATNGFSCNGISLLVAFNADNCSVIAVTAGVQGACNPNDNSYTQSLTVYYINAPASGQLMVNGVGFPIAGSPQIVTLTGLPSDGVPVDVTAYFSADPDCAITTEGVFEAPPSCITFIECGAASLSSAGVYDNGWQSGDDDGAGFGGWQLNTTGGNAGHFIYTSTSNGDGNSNADNDIDSGGEAWGMYANSGSVSNAIRPFDVALTPGSTFSIKMDNGWIESGGSVGFGLQDASGNNRMEFYFRNGQSNYKINDNAGETDTGLGFSDEGLNLVFTLVTSTTYSLEITRLEGGSYTRNGTLINPGAGQPIARARLFNANAGFDGQRNAYFNNLQICTPQSTCQISDLAAGAQTSCDEETNFYTQAITVTYLNPPPVGQLVVNGQYFAITSSPQTVVLNGLESDGQPVNVTAYFSATPACTFSENALFTAPDNCLPCSIINLEAGDQTACVEDVYSQEVIVTYEYAPLSGSLVVNNQSFPITGSPQTVVLSGLEANNEPVSVYAYFSDDEGCNFDAVELFEAPEPCPACAIIGVEAGAQTACVPISNTYTQTITVEYILANLSGYLVVNGQYFPVTGSPQTVVLAGLPADGNPVDVEVSITDQQECTFLEESLFVAPVSCADEGNCVGDFASASTYNDGWGSGDNGGAGFNAWQLNASGANAGHFVFTSTQNGDGDGNSDGDIDTGGKAWGLYANSGDVSNAVRPFAQPMSAGDQLRFKFDNGWINNGGTAGFGLRNSSGQNLLEFYFAGGSPAYTRHDGNGPQSTGIGFTDEGLEVSIVLLSGNAYEMTVRRLSDNFIQHFSGPLSTVAGGQIPAQIRFFNANSGFSSERNTYVNQLELCRLCTQAPVATCQEVTVLLNTVTNTITVPATNLASASGCGPFTMLADGQAQLTFDCQDLGSNQVTILVTDANEATSQCSATVVVAENVPPTVNCKPATIYLNGAGQATLMPADVFLNGSDNCGTVTPQSVSPNAFTCTQTGTHTVTLTAVDGYANTSTCAASVTVVDNTMPSISAPPTATIYKDNNCQYNADPSVTGLPSVGDNCSATLPAPTYMDAVNAGTCSGSLVITRTWTITDASNNSKTALQTIHVLDQIAPNFTTYPGAGSAPCGNTSALGTWLANRAGAQASDNCSAVSWASPTLTNTVEGCGNTACYTYQFVAKDACNNSVSASATFCFTDNTPPTPVCRSTNVTLNENGSYSLQASDVIELEGPSPDNCGSVSVAGISPATLSCAQVGAATPVVVTVADECGNTTTCTAYITANESSQLPGGWSQGVTGNATGSANNSACSGGVLTISATGFSTSSQDGTYQAYQQLCGNGQITARVAGISSTGGWAGIFMRENLNAGARKVALKTQLGTFVKRDVRTMANGAVNSQQFPVPQGHSWLRLVRNGNVFSIFTSDNGALWVFRGSSTLALPSCLMVGLFAESINVNTTTTATFSNIFIQGSQGNIAGPSNEGQLPAPDEVSEMLAFPNPATDRVNLSFKGLSRQQVWLTLINSTGQTVWSRQMEVAEGQLLELDVSSFSDGIYLIRLDAGNYLRLTQKIVLAPR